MRITDHPILTDKKKKKEIKFIFEGREMIAYEGDSIAAALIANNIRVFRTSSKLSRPRGLFCSIGKCASCLMVVNGNPNVMTCITPIEMNMDIKKQEGKGDII